MDKVEFLDKFIFYGLENLNDGSDTSTIRYFSEADFKIVLERVEKLNIVIHGIEPWKDGTCYDLLCSEDFDQKEAGPAWYWEAFQRFIDTGEELKYAASYDVHEHLIKGTKRGNKT